MSDRIHELLNRNLQEVFGEGDATRRRAAIEELYTDDCILEAPPDATRWISLRRACARLILTSRIRLTASRRRSIAPAVWLGGLVRAGRSPTIPVST